MMLAFVILAYFLLTSCRVFAPCPPPEVFRQTFGDRWRVILNINMQADPVIFLPSGAHLLVSENCDGGNIELQNRFCSSAMLKMKQFLEAETSIGVCGLVTLSW